MSGLGGGETIFTGIYSNIPECIDNQVPVRRASLHGSEPVLSLSTSTSLTLL